MLELTVWMALLAGFFVAPIVHWRIRRTKFWGVRTTIAALVFAPGLCATALTVWFHIAINLDTWVNRWQLVYYLQGEGALICLEKISKITAIYLGVCLLLEYFLRRAVGDGERDVARVIEAWRSLVAMQLALMAVTAYLYTYNTLEYAVTSDNLALAEKRLNWNLEGLGPNYGLVVDFREPKLYPLLPVAVKNGNYDMVTLLVKHGADLNPKGWGEYTRLESGTYVKSALYFAVRSHDSEMIAFLIDLGVNPEQGIYPALMERDQELLSYFLDNGADLGLARDKAKHMGWNQQRIDEFFSGYSPRTEVESGQ